MQPLSIFALDLDNSTKQLLEKKSVKTIQQLQNLLADKNSNVEVAKVQKMQASIMKCKLISESLHNSNVVYKTINRKTHLLDVAVSQGCITEVYGEKASGKTSILLKAIQIYIQNCKNQSVLLLNCASGITYKKLLPIRDRVIYRDIYQIGDIYRYIKQQIKQQPIGLIAIDEFGKFIKLRTRPEDEIVLVINLLKECEQKMNISSIFSNSMVGDKIKLDKQQYCYNNISEFSASSTSLLDNRIVTHKDNHNNFTMIALKCKYNIDARVCEYTIDEDGVHY